jgi:hypothetical protein
VNVEKFWHELRGGVKVLSNGEISGSRRNAFRGSLEPLLTRGRATERGRGATRLHAPTKLRILVRLSRE